MASDDGFLISPGAAVGLFFIILIVVITLLVICLRRRSQSKLYRAAVEIDPDLTRAEFRHRQKAQYAGDRINEEQYEKERRQKREKVRVQRRVDRRAISGPIVDGEPLMQGGVTGGTYTHGLEVVDSGGTGPYSQEWRAEQAELLRERRRLLRQVAASSRQEGRAGAWAEEVNTEMDISLARWPNTLREPVSLSEPVLVEVPRNTAPQTRRPEPSPEDSEALPEYTVEVLPPYVANADGGEGRTG